MLLPLTFNYNRSIWDPTNKGSEVLWTLYLSIGALILLAFIGALLDFGDAKIARHLQAVEDTGAKEGGVLPPPASSEALVSTATSASSTVVTSNSTSRGSYSSSSSSSSSGSSSNLSNNNSDVHRRTGCASVRLGFRGNGSYQSQTQSYTTSTKAINRTPSTQQQQPLPFQQTLHIIDSLALSPSPFIPKFVMLLKNTHTLFSVFFLYNATFSRPWRLYVIFLNLMASLCAISTLYTCIDLSELIMFALGTRKISELEVILIYSIVGAIASLPMCTLFKILLEDIIFIETSSFSSKSNFDRKINLTKKKSEVKSVKSADCESITTTADDDVEGNYGSDSRSRHKAIIDDEIDGIVGSNFKHSSSVPSIGNHFRSVLEGRINAVLSVVKDEDRRFESLATLERRKRLVSWLHSDILLTITPLCLLLVLQKGAGTSNLDMEAAYDNDVEVGEISQISEPMEENVFDLKRFKTYKRMLIGPLNNIQFYFFNGCNCGNYFSRTCARACRNCLSYDISRFIALAIVVLFSFALMCYLIFYVGNIHSNVVTQGPLSGRDVCSGDRFQFCIASSFLFWVILDCFFICTYQIIIYKMFIPSLIEMYSQRAQVLVYKMAETYFLWLSYNSGYKPVSSQAISTQDLDNCSKIINSDMKDINSNRSSSISSTLNNSSNNNSNSNSHIIGSRNQQEEGSGLEACPISIKSLTLRLATANPDLLESKLIIAHGPMFELLRYQLSDIHLDNMNSTGCSCVGYFLGNFSRLVFAMLLKAFAFFFNLQLTHFHDMQRKIMTILTIGSFSVTVLIIAPPLVVFLLHVSLVFVVYKLYRMIIADAMLSLSIIAARCATKKAIDFCYNGILEPKIYNNYRSHKADLCVLAEDDNEENDDDNDVDDEKKNKDEEVNISNGNKWGDDIYKIDEGSDGEGENAIVGGMILEGDLDHHDVVTDDRIYEVDLTSTSIERDEDEVGGDEGEKYPEKKEEKEDYDVNEKGKDKDEDNGKVKVKAEVSSSLIDYDSDDEKEIDLHILSSADEVKSEYKSENENYNRDHEGGSGSCSNGEISHLPSDRIKKAVKPSPLVDFSSDDDSDESEIKATFIGKSADGKRKIKERGGGGGGGGGSDIDVSDSSNSYSGDSRESRREEVSDDDLSDSGDDGPGHPYKEKPKSMKSKGGGRSTGNPAVDVAKKSPLNSPGRPKSNPVVVVVDEGDDDDNDGSDDESNARKNVVEGGDGGARDENYDYEQRTKPAVLVVSSLPVEVTATATNDVETIAGKPIDPLVSYTDEIETLRQFFAQKCELPAALSVLYAKSLVQQDVYSVKQMCVQKADGTLDEMFFKMKVAMNVISIINFELLQYSRNKSIFPSGVDDGVPSIITAVPFEDYVKEMSDEGFLIIDSKHKVAKPYLSTINTAPATNKNSLDIDNDVAFNKETESEKDLLSSFQNRFQANTAISDSDSNYNSDRDNKADDLNNIDTSRGESRNNVYISEANTKSDNNFNDPLGNDGNDDGGELGFRAARNPPPDFKSMIGDIRDTFNESSRSHSNRRRKSRDSNRHGNHFKSGGYDSIAFNLGDKIFQENEEVLPYQPRTPPNVDEILYRSPVVNPKQYLRNLKLKQQAKAILKHRLAHTGSSKQADSNKDDLDDGDDSRVAPFTPPSGSEGNLTPISGRGSPVDGLGNAEEGVNGSDGVGSKLCNPSSSKKDKKGTKSSSSAKSKLIDTLELDKSLVANEEDLDKLLVSRWPTSKQASSYYLLSSTSSSDGKGDDDSLGSLSSNSDDENQPSPDAGKLPSSREDKAYLDTLSTEDLYALRRKINSGIVAKYVSEKVKSVKVKGSRSRNGLGVGSRKESASRNLPRTLPSNSNSNDSPSNLSTGSNNGSSSRSSTTGFSNVRVPSKKKP